MQFGYLGREDPLEEGMATHSSILPGKFHGQWSLVDYSSWGCKGSNRTEHTAHIEKFPTLGCILLSYLDRQWRKNTGSSSFMDKILADGKNEDGSYCSDHCKPGSQTCWVTPDPASAKSLSCRTQAPKRGADRVMNLFVFLIF